MSTKKSPVLLPTQTQKVYVTLHGQVKYHGRYGTEESIKAYERIIAEYLADLPRDDAATVVELCADYFGPQAQQILQRYLFSENPFPYTTHSCRRAIHRACDRAGIPR